MQSLRKLTFTRFVAASIVVIFHFGNGIWPFSSPYVKWLLIQGGPAVSYFYCLSGFIMATAYPVQRPIDSRSFWIARFARIYPCFLLSLFVGQWFARAGLLDFILTAIGGQPWVVTSLDVINAPGWSIGVEAIFYLIFPFAIRALGTRRKAMSIAIIAIWIASAVINYLILHRSGIKYPSFGFNFALHNPLMHLNEFLLGVLTGTFAQEGTMATSKWLRPWLPAAVISAIFIFEPIVAGWEWARGLQLSSGLMAPFFVWLIWAIAASAKDRLRLFESRFAILLGEASYALYILQLPIQLAFHEYLSPFIPLPALGGFLAYALTLVVISVAVHLCLEAPARKLIRRALTKNTPRAEVSRQSSAA